MLPHETILGANSAPTRPAGTPREPQPQRDEVEPVVDVTLGEEPTTAWDDTDWFSAALMLALVLGGVALVWLL